MNFNNLYIIAGSNGAGKTTASYTILPEILDCKEFVNAEEIAKGLSPFQPEKVAIETTLSTKSYKNKILEAKKKNYQITLIFFWLNSVELAKERVSLRVKEGGHNIPNDVIERRYKKGINNLFEIYLPIVDKAMIFDNSQGKSILIAEKFHGKETIILENKLFNNLISYYNVHR